MSRQAWCTTMKLRVLFIGNSHTYLHYMPQMLVQLVKAADCGFDLAVDQSIGEGASLEWHWNNGPTRQKMRSRKWDYIVLQDRSGGPLENLNSFQKHARLLDAEIKKLGAATIMFLTWANRDLPDTQVLLAEAYCRTAIDLQALVAPVGPAWTRAGQASTGLVLHHKDGRHASPAGAYLTACVFYAILFNTSPVGLPATILVAGKLRPDQSRTQALLLQKAAWDTVRKSEVEMPKGGK